MSPGDDRGRPGEEAASSVVTTDKPSVSRRTLHIEYENEWCTHIRGAGAERLCEVAGRRKPIWSCKSRSFVVTAATARKVTELAAEAGDLDIVVTRTRVAGVKQDYSVYTPEQGSLW